MWTQVSWATQGCLSVWNELTSALLRQTRPEQPNVQLGVYSFSGFTLFSQQITGLRKKDLASSTPFMSRMWKRLLQLQQKLWILQVLLYLPIAFYVSPTVRYCLLAHCGASGAYDFTITSCSHRQLSWSIAAALALRQVGMLHHFNLFSTARLQVSQGHPGLHFPSDAHSRHVLVVVVWYWTMTFICSFYCFLVYLVWGMQGWYLVFM